jgi:membrane-bound lytic murein transglycosylase F
MRPWLGWLLTLATAGTAATASSSEVLELETPGTLRVLVEANALPELYGPTGGVERAMMEGFARLHRLRLATVTVPRVPDRIPWLLEGKGDVLAGGVVVTEARKKLVSFAATTFPIRHIAVTRKPHAVVRTVEDLRTHLVGVTRNSSWAEEALAAGVPKANLDDSYASTEEVMRALREGKVNCVVLSIIWAVAEVRRDPDLQLGVMIGEPTGISFAVRKEQPNLLAALNSYVVATRNTPTWSRLVVEHLGPNALDVLKMSRE